MRDTLYAWQWNLVEWYARMRKTVVAVGETVICGHMVIWCRGPRGPSEVLTVSELHIADGSIDLGRLGITVVKEDEVCEVRDTVVSLSILSFVFLDMAADSLSMSALGLESVESMEFVWAVLMDTEVVISA